MNIPVKDFRHLDIQHVDWGDDVLAGPYASYACPTVDRNRIMELWSPQPSTSLHARHKRHASPEENCERWLAKMMRSNPDNKPKPKMKMYQEACRLFPDLGSAKNIRPSAAFERAWHQARGKTKVYGWSKPGAPKGKRAKIYEADGLPDK
jgi:hypothetical protein